MRTAKLVILATFLGSAMVAGAADWQQLCNGENLDGWTSKPDIHHWSVVDGVITGANGPEKKGSVLWTDETFSEFVFETDVRFSGVVDSGIFVKENRYQVNLGISMSLKVDRTCCIYAPKDDLGKYPGMAEGVAELWKKDDWNTIRIEARGKHIIVTLNGIQVLDYETKALTESGPIGLQIHAGLDEKVEFRNSRILR